MDVLPSGLPSIVADDEPLARFVLSGAHMNSTGAKPAAFLPREGSAGLSVYRLPDTPMEPVWDMAAAHVESAERRVRAAAFVAAHVVRSAHSHASAGTPRLDLDANDHPPRHANIVGWASITSDVDAAHAKAVNKALALAISQRASLVRK